jgi:general stress protein 26
MNNASHILAIATYIKQHPVMVLGTVDEHRQPRGAAVYIYTDDLKWVYFITKTETAKFQNIHDNTHISLTSFDEDDNSTLQITGRAQTVNSAETIEMVMSNISKIYAHRHVWLPPIAKFRAGPYQVVSIKLQHARLAKYADARPGDPGIFKEISADDL